MAHFAKALKWAGDRFIDLQINPISRFTKTQLLSLDYVV